MGYAIKKESWRAKQFLGTRKAVDTRPWVYRASGRVIQATFAATLFVSAALVFISEPMVAKMLLPYLGGAPAVWTTCMVFFQTALLGGYLYAHASSTKLSLHNQTIFHYTLIVLSVIFVPMGVAGGWQVLADAHPVFGVLGALIFTVGLPFFTLSSTAPLLQHWFAKTDSTVKNPYLLYGASNLGSLLALMSYPTWIEPVFGLSGQSFYWGAGYCVLAILMVVCIYFVRAANIGDGTAASPLFTAPKVEVETSDEPAPSIRQRARWVALAFVPSSLMLGVTTYFTTDIATIPLLWALPLAMYLLSFILVFAVWPQKVQNVLSYVAPAVGIGLLFLIVSRAHLGVAGSLAWHLGAFFLLTLMFHGDLALSRPSARHLTQFYLWMSFGGMLGGVFNAVIAPITFETALEYPLVLAAGLILSRFAGRVPFESWKWTNRVLDVVIPGAIGGLTFWLLTAWPLAKLPLDGIAGYFQSTAYQLLPQLSYGIPAVLAALTLIFRRPIRMGLAVLAFAGTALITYRFDQMVVFQDRSFFGVLKVSEDYVGRYRTLVNGTTLHGRQNLDPEIRREPLTYYHRQGPVGSIFQEFHGPTRKESLGFIGLGTGTLASYGEPGQKLTFFEIDDAVVKIAKEHFTFLADCEADYRIIMGDARVKLEEIPDNEFGLLFVDAFSSDAIPVHLLTREAIELYFKKVQKDGIVAIHTSNRYLSLEPIVGRLAKEAGLVARVNHDNGDNLAGKFASTWIVLARDVAHLKGLAKNPAWAELGGFSWIPVWSDDFTSLWEVLR